MKPNHEHKDYKAPTIILKAHYCDYRKKIVEKYHCLSFFPVSVICTLLFVIVHTKSSKSSFVAVPQCLSWCIGVFIFLVLLLSHCHQQSLAWFSWIRILIWKVYHTKNLCSCCSCADENRRPKQAKINRRNPTSLPDNPSGLDSTELTPSLASGLDFRSRLFTMNPESWALNNVELLQQIGTLLWTSTGDPQMTQQLAKLRVGYELYQRLSGEREMEALRNLTILNISNWIKDHPKASKEEMSKEIGKQITQFAAQVENMWTVPISPTCIDELDHLWLIQVIVKWPTTFYGCVH